MNAYLRSLGVRASAGTGKTYQLVQRYLALLALGEQAGATVQSMVALTFTRKAAREFAGRILQDLATAAQSEEQARVLANRIEQVWRGEMQDSHYGNIPCLLEGEVILPQLKQQDFLRLLIEVCSSIDKMQLTTLDAFFSRVARSFSYDLGMAGFQLLDDAEYSAARSEVLSELFGAENQAAEQRAFVLTLQNTFFGKEEVNWQRNVNELLDQLQELWWKLPDCRYWGGMEQKRTDWQLDEASLVGILADVEVLLSGENTGIVAETTEKRKQFLENSILELAQSLSQGEMPASRANIVKILITQGVYLDDSWSTLYYNKTVRLCPLLTEKLQQLFRHTWAKMCFTCVTRTRAQGEFLQRYEARYAEKVRRKGLLGFAELGALLAGMPVLPQTDTSLAKWDLEARMNERIEHWMLDEFQDTSRMQWRVLENWLDEVVVYGEGKRSLFVVGDTKQAIYGWRGGDSRLFAELWQRPGWQEKLDEWGMSQSYRSTTEVLEMVNCIFARQTHVEEQFDLAGIESFAEIWQCPEHSSARTDLAGCGYASLRCLPERSAKDPQTQQDFWEKIADWILESEVDKREISVAVLVRRGKTATEAGNALRSIFRQRKIFLAIEVEGEANLAQDSPLGLALTDLFTWLAFPADQFAWKHVCMSCLRSLFAQQSPEQAWLQLWELWQNQGPVAILQWVATQLEFIEEQEQEDGQTEFNLGVKLGKYQQSRWRAWQELALSWMRKGGGSLQQWLLQLEHAKQREYAHSGAVQILTVHKSKGLQWDFVLYVETDKVKWDDASRFSQLIGSNKTGEAFVLSKPDSFVVDSDLELSRAFLHWRKQQYEEGLCVSYVALTRAKRALCVVVPPASKKKNSSEKKTFSETNWLRAGVGEPESKEEILWESQSSPAAWFTHMPKKEQIFEKTKQKQLHLGKVAPKIQRLAPSQLPEASSRKAVFSQSSQDAALYGRLLHQKAAMLPLLSDSSATSVAAGIFQGEGLEGEAAKALQFAWESAYFAWAWGEKQPNLEHHWQCWRERAFEILLEKHWVSGVFDRVLICRDALGFISSARIIEIKTDTLTTADQLRSKHKSQLLMYKQVLSKLLSLEEAQIEAKWLWLPRNQNAKLVDLTEASAN